MKPKYIIHNLRKRVDSLMLEVSGLDVVLSELEVCDFNDTPSELEACDFNDTPSVLEACDFNDILSALETCDFNDTPKRPNPSQHRSTHQFPDDLNLADADSDEVMDEYVDIRDVDVPNGWYEVTLEIIIDVGTGESILLFYFTLRNGKGEVYRVVDELPPNYEEGELEEVDEIYDQLFDFLDRAGIDYDDIVNTYCTHKVRAKFTRDSSDFAFMMLSEVSPL